MKCCSISMQIMYRIWVCFESRFSEKVKCLKKPKPRRPLYSCSRIRVGEGSPHEEGTSTFRSILNKSFKITSRKNDAKIWRNTGQINVKRSQYPSKTHPRINHIWKLVTGSPKMETGSWKMEIGIWGMETGCQKMEPECRKWCPVARKWCPVASIRWAAPQYPEFRVPNSRIPGGTLGPNILIDLQFDYKKEIHKIYLY